MKNFKLILMMVLVLGMAGLANAAVVTVTGPGDLDLTNVIKAINFGESVSFYSWETGPLSVTETVGTTTFLVSTVNETVDGVTNIGHDAITGYSWGGTAPEFGATADDDALERIFASGVIGTDATQ
ncbi:MAG: hypothetical protein GY799_02790, partial [Desulfobulbaceae bacterium]|nr:hypothetical protein [Desulfobulbaceae bacterium]